MSKFGNWARAKAEQINADVDQVIRASLVDVSTRIIKRTPVGNPKYWKTKYPPIGYIGGAARGNWFASVGTPANASDTSKIDDDGDATISVAMSAIASATGNVYYLTNNLPYIFRLEYQGWSTQAPQGMVRVSVLEFNAALTKAINEL